MQDSLFTQADINALEAGINSALSQIETLLVAEAFAADLPVFGTQLKQGYDAANAALTTVSTLKNAIVSALDTVSNRVDLSALTKEQVKAALQTSLDSVLAGLGSDFEKLVTITVGETGNIKLEFDTARATNLTFYAADLGMDALGLSLAGTANAALVYDFNFTAGLDDKGFYLDGANTHLTLGANVSLGNLTADADFGYLSFNASNIQDGLENARGQAVTSGGGDTLSLNFTAGLAPSLIRSFGSDILNVSASGNVDLDLHLGAAMGGTAAPSIGADLHVDYTFTGVLLKGNVATDWGDVLVKLDNVQYDLGDFIENFVRPVFEKIAVVLVPINQALDVLRYDIGTILPDDWENALDIAGGEDGSPDGQVTVLDLLAATGLDVAPLAQFLNVIEQITDIANVLTADIFNPGFMFDVGGYQLVIDDLSDATQALNKLDFASGTFQSVSADILQLLSGLADGSVNDQTLYTDLLEGRAATALVGDILDSSIFSIPIIQDPSKAIQFLMGQTVDLVTFDMAPVSLGAGFNLDGTLGDPITIASSPIWLMPPITLNIGIAFQAVIDLAFGFDSSGFENWASLTNFDMAQAAMIFEGLYLDDQIVGGMDKAEIILRAAVEIGGRLEAGVGSISGGGNILGELLLDLTDSLVGNDGKLYFNEAFADPFSLLEIDGGRITAGFRAALDLGIPPFRGTVWSYQSPRVTLVDISDQADASADAPPGLGDMIGSELNVNVGARAGERDIANKSDGDDNFEISSAGPSGARVSAFGYSEAFPKLGEPNITRIIADGGIGDDQILLDTTLAVAATLTGGEGRDTLQGGSQGDILNGGTENDWLIGNGGEDVLHGGAGNDYLEGGAGGDQFNGGDGDFDIASYINSSSGVSVDLNLIAPGVSGDAVGDTFVGVEGVEGSVHADVLKGSAARDMLYGADGNDTLVGGGGDDWLIGGLGSNSIDGGTQYDVVSYYFATAGVTINQTSAGGTATLVVGANLTINDSFIKVEEVHGSSFADVMTGGSGNQVFQGMDGNDRLDGGADNDFLVGGRGGDTLIGGSGQDIASYSGSQVGVTINLVSGGTGGDAQDDSFSGIEEVRGSEHGDTIIGDGLVNTLRGYRGNDRLDGAAGDDSLEGGDGADQLTGGAGRDEASYRNATAGVSVNLRTNVHSGEAAGDTFSGIEIISGSAVADTIRGSDTITSTAESREELLGNGGADLLYGGLGHDTLRGGDANDRLLGEEGDDVLFGDAGADRLQGGTGADEFAGGAGNDNFDGGADRDRVTYLASSTGVVVNLSVAAQTKGGTSSAALKALDGLGGSDSFVQAAGLSTVEDASGSDFADWVVASEGGSELLGMGGADRLYGLAGADVLNGGIGADLLDGAGGTDTASYASDQAGVSADLLAGTATDGSGAIDTFVAIENLVGSAHADTLQGDGVVNRLEGGANNDTLDGRAGADIMLGGVGDDIYFVDRVMSSDGNDTVIEQSSGGSDLIKASVDYGSASVVIQLAAEVEDLLLLGSVAFGYGNSLANRMIGNGAANVLNGLGGADNFWGYGGNDVYYFDSTGDSIGLGNAFRSDIAGNGEVAGGGIDEIRLATANLTPANTMTSYTLDTVWGQQVENLVLIDNDRNVSLTGNALGNVLVGNAHWQVLSGGPGNDVLDPHTGRDTVHGGDGRDTLRINWSAITYDINTGISGSPGTGYDGVYYWGPNANDGNFDRVDFSGVETFDITMGSGNDYIGTGDGADRVLGGAGNDHINSRKGIDVINGGDGNDRWEADKSEATNLQPMLLNLKATGVQASYMGSGSIRGIEMLSLITGAGADVITTLDARFNDAISTSGGDDRVILAGGRDVVDLGSGNDRLVIDWADIDYNQATGISGSLADGYSGTFYWGPNANDGNFDRVDFSGVETFDITMGSGNDYIGTGDGADRVLGGAGNDHINSRKGIDVINGGDGNDRWEADKSEATNLQPMLLNLKATGVQASYMGSGSIRGIEMLSLITGAGADVITTLDARFNDAISTSGGDDRVILAGGRDVVDLGSGNDRLVIDWADIDYNQATGISGSLADGYSGTFYWGPNANDGNFDRVDFSGVETFDITMGSGNDSVGTGDGDDIVRGGAGFDLLNTGKGADTVIGGNNLDGSRGADRWTADKSNASKAMTIDLTVNTASTYQIGLRTGSMAGIEALGSPGSFFQSGSDSDVIRTMNARLDDFITTNAGGDTVSVAGGRDNVQMGDGLDTLMVDWSDIDNDVNTYLSGLLPTGYDGVYYYTANGNDGNFDRVDFQGVDKFEITMGSGNDYVATGDGNDQVIGGAGNDHLNTAKGLDVIDGGAGNDRWEADKSLATSAEAIAIDLNATGVQSSYFGAGTVYGIEMLTLSTGAAGDTVTTLNAFFNDIVITNAGEDTVTFAGGRDLAEMGDGNDSLVIDWSGIDYPIWTSLSGVLASGYSGTYYYAPNGNDGNFSRADFTGVERFDVAVGSGNDFVATGDGADKVLSGAGDDHLLTGKGADIIDGGTGKDRWEADKSHATELQPVVLNLRLAAIQGTYLGTGTVSGIEMLSLTTGSGDDVITTLDARFNDVLNTRAGADLVTVAGGRDTIDLGVGIDTLVLDWSEIDYGIATAISGSLAGGFSGTFYWAPNGNDGNFDRLDFAGVEKFDVHTGSGNDAIVTGAGDDRMDGGLGLDAIDGGGGNDTAVYASRNEAVVLTLNRATIATVFVGGAVEDTVVNVENVLGGFGNDQLTGDGANNRLEGGGGNDVIDGKGGNDFLSGGAGIDTLSYQGAQSGVTVSLELTSAQNTFGAGIDSISGFENLVGSGRDDDLTGNTLANTIDGGVGTDKMSGGGGNDVYFIDSALDRIFETLTTSDNDTTDAGGLDLVNSSVTASLTAYNGVKFVENLTLTGAAAISGTGNALANEITGNEAANTLSGGLGDDVLLGNGGNDELDGGAGADRMLGGAGNDSYIIDNTLDRVFETLTTASTDTTDTGGIDLVSASITASLTAYNGLRFVENLTLTGTSAINGTGNDLANRITGNEAANVLSGQLGNDTLDGGAGIDYLYGGAGNDSYIVDNTSDRVYETATSTDTVDTGGTDTVSSSVTYSIAASNNGRQFIENLTLTGSAAINATGNALANTLTGNAAANSLTGGGGKDTMTGGLGADRFVFADGDFGGATGATGDIIKDFTAAEGDKIVLSAVDANAANGSATNEAFSFIGTAAFGKVAGQLRTFQSTTSTFVQGDTNGDGTADFVLVLTGAMSLAQTDFIL